MSISRWVRRYKDWNINLIPLREREKTPLQAWDEFKSRFVTDREVEEWLSRGIKNFGAVCGSISNNLLVIDVDKEELFSKLYLGAIASKTFTVKTGKGYHIYLRICDPTFAPTRYAPLKRKSLTWGEHEEIRFQGEGMYVVCAGSRHPSGVFYEHVITSPQEIKKADSRLLGEIERRWRKYHGIEKLEKERGVIRLKTKRAEKLEDFKSRVSLTDVVGRYVSKVKDYGTYWQGHCPFRDHEDHVPSFTVYEDTKSYYCFGCERHGDVINFIEKKEGKSFIDAIKRIEEITGVEYFSKKVKEVKEEKSEEEKKINPSDVDDLIRTKRKFVTLRDTEEVLHYENTRGGAWRFNAEAVIREETEKILRVLGKRGKVTRYFVNEVVGHVQRSTYIDRGWLNTEKEKINLLNGVYDLETEQLLPHDSRYYFTYIIPVKHNFKADCPKIKEFLKDILPEDDIKTMLQFVGYCMLSIIPFHKAMIFLGDGANGKSTLIELIRSFLGDKNTSSHSLQSIMEERFTKADMYGRLANLYADIPKDALRHTSIFKILTGGDTLSAEKKFKEPFIFKNTAKLIFSANVLPRTIDDTEAFFRRWLIITFPNKFEGKRCDPKMLEKLTTSEELSGFLNLVLDALKQLLRDGEFYKSKVAAEIREEYINKSNPVQSFVLNCLELDPGSYETKDGLYSAFIRYCKENKLPDVDKRIFGSRLPRYATEVRTEKKKLFGARVQCWRGIRLKDEHSEQQPSLKREKDVSEADGTETFVCARCGEAWDIQQRSSVKSKDGKTWFVCRACHEGGQPSTSTSALGWDFSCKGCGVKNKSIQEFRDHVKSCEDFRKWLKAKQGAEERRKEEEVRW